MTLEFDIVYLFIVLSGAYLVCYSLARLVIDHYFVRKREYFVALARTFDGTPYEEGADHGAT